MRDSPVDTPPEDTPPDAPRDAPRDTPLDAPPDLPDELWMMVFEHVPWRGRVALRAVSPRWRGLLDGSPGLWRDVPEKEPWHAFVAGCQRGDLAAAHQLARTFKFNIKAMAAAERGGAAHAIAQAAKGGHLDVIIWLIEFFALRPNRAGFYVLCGSCPYGLLAVAQWAANRFNPETADVRGNNNHILRAVCQEGYLLVAQWLVDRFGLTVEDARADQDAAFRHACAFGHLEVAQWLSNRFPIPAADIPNTFNLSFWHSCVRGHLSVARWLVDYYEPPGEVVRDIIPGIIARVDAKKHPDVVAWLSDLAAA